MSRPIAPPTLAQDALGVQGPWAGASGAPAWRLGAVVADGGVMCAALEVE